jgi:hypothetical protein
MTTLDARGPASARMGIRPPRVRLPVKISTATLAMAVMAMLGTAPANAASPDTAVSSTPDSIQLARLRQETSKPQTIRLRGTFGTQEITRPLFDSTGVSSGESVQQAYHRPGLIVTDGALQLTPQLTPQPIAWSEISEIQTGHAMVGRGALAGFVVGVMLVTLSAQMNKNLSEEEAYQALSASLAAITLTTVTGMIIGSRCGWRTIYRPSAAPRP